MAPAAKSNAAGVALAKKVGAAALNASQSSTTVQQSPKKKPYEAEPEIATQPKVADGKQADVTTVASTAAPSPQEDATASLNTSEELPSDTLDLDSEAAHANATPADACLHDHCLVDVSISNVSFLAYWVEIADAELGLQLKSVAKEQRPTQNQKKTWRFGKQVF